MVKQGLRLVIGSWKIIAMSLPMICAPLAAADGEEIAAVERQPVGGDRGGPGQKAHDGQHGHRLAGAGFANDRQDLARRRPCSDTRSTARNAPWGWETRR